MLIKFMGGRGGGGAIAAYLVARDRPGREAAAPEVLRGDIDRTRELIDSIDRKWTYTTGVISFSREDAPSEDQQREVMDDFERVAFAGMDPEQYDIAWVRHSHTEGGRTELHFLTPRMELTTGKALNIAPPGWERTYAPLRDAWNHEQGWARPDDPERARTLQAGHQREERAQTREAVTAFLEQRIAAGEIEDRAGIVRALEEVGFDVPRQGKDYITAADPETEARFRLKGRIYERDWTRTTELDRAASREVGGGAESDRGVDHGRAAAARYELEQVIEGRARRHGEGYGRSAEQYAEPTGRHRDPAEALAALDRLGFGRDRPGSLRLALDHHELGAVRSEDSAEREIRGATGVGHVAGADARDLASGGSRGHVPDRAGKHGKELVDVRRRVLPEAIGVERNGDTNDIRTRALARVRNLSSHVREIGENLSQYGRTTVESIRAFLGADRAAEEEANRAGRTLERGERCLGHTDTSHKELNRASERIAARTRELKRDRKQSIEREKIHGYGWGL